MIIWQGTVSIVNQPLVWKFNPQRINTRNHLKFCNIKIHSKSPQANGLNERWRTFFGLPMRNEVDRKLLIGFKWRGKWSNIVATSLIMTIFIEVYVTFLMLSERVFQFRWFLFCIILQFLLSINLEILLYTGPLL